MTITLVDATDDSITISWTAVKDADRYVLQYCKADSDNNANSDFETLSDKLTSTQAKKKNLTSGTNETSGRYFFRVGALLQGSDSSSLPTTWITHADAFELLTSDAQTSRPHPPTVTLAGANDALIISWKPHDGATDYAVQMRENIGGSEWVTIASNFSNTQVKKKNLSNPSGYQFRVRPNLEGLPYSSPSTPVAAIGLSDGIKRLFRSLENGTLLKDSSSSSGIPLVDALGGKEFVLLYASASWCGPCRQFTPKLSKWYNSLGPNKTVEVVFLSADHDANSFKSYYSHMPWLAVAHEEDTREELMSYIRVKGIPHLAVLDARTGRIIEENAVSKPLDINRWRSLVYN
ncbi:hypothetical protein FisN_3Hh183 [Fistulifera solaris]|uniref:protein-disulfide reductase n=1 Tax=Fistulifera solaris TaxID=1519565 RepID=A0A1Z5JP17_FISSO|nr:hypothetical protein FisN_3Hh183 [Fistulifera solaris]|eukprot:GAX15709.1 hypothetical protein FisN_3Hh183 [Fistulifera solaris]